MAHFGLICPPASSHLPGLASIGRELLRRGHQITGFNIPDAEKILRAEGISFHAIGIREHPLGSFKAFSEKITELQGLNALRFGLRPALSEIDTLLSEGPTALRSSKVDALIVDQGQPAGSTLADILNVPFFTVCNASPANQEPSVPPTPTSWVYSTTILAKLRNELGYSALALALSPLLRAINRYRKAYKLRPLRSLNDTFSPLAQISQQSPEFDFPHHQLPAHFHHIGLFHRPGSASTSFPFERLESKPIVYATFGTILKGRPDVIGMLAQACSAVGSQLVLTLGGNGKVADLAGLAGNPVVVSYAPQLELLKRASLTVCHAGNNTVLESLAADVPVIAFPVWGDQPSVAARLVYSGAGERLSLKNLSLDQLTAVCRQVLVEPRYRERARYIGASIRKGGGEVRAADIIESCLHKN